MPVNTIVRAASLASRIRSSSSRWSTSAAAARRIASGWPAYLAQEQVGQALEGSHDLESTAAAGTGAVDSARPVCGSKKWNLRRSTVRRIGVPGPHEVRGSTRAQNTAVCSSASSGSHHRLPAPRPRSVSSVSTGGASTANRTLTSGAQILGGVRRSPRSWGGSTWTRRPRPPGPRDGSPRSRPDPRPRRDRDRRGSDLEPREPHWRRRRPSRPPEFMGGEPMNAATNRFAGRW